MLPHTVHGDKYNNEDRNKEPDGRSNSCTTKVIEITRSRGTFNPGGLFLLLHIRGDAL